MLQNVHMNYVNDLMINHHDVYQNFSDSDTDDIHLLDKNTLHGGNDNEKNKPTGGFPPIYVCDKEIEKKLTDSKKREYLTLKSSINIKEIMEKRRDVTPFI